MKRIYLALILGCVCVLTTAQENEKTLWETAQDAFVKGDYDASVKAFNDYLAVRPSSYAAMYNIGNCYLQKSDLGKAILWYERAKKIKPHDGDIMQNLAIAKARRENPVVEIREFFLMRWLRSWSGFLSVPIWGLCSLLFFWIAIGGIVLQLRSGQQRKLRLVVIGAIAGFVLSVIFGAQRYHGFTRDNVAITTQPEAEVSIAPDEGSKLVARIEAGEKVVIVDSLNNYYKIRLANFEQGWITMDNLEKI